MSTRERSKGRAASRARVAGGLGLVMLVPVTAVGGAHGLWAGSSPDAAVVTPAAASTTVAKVRVAPAVILSRWDEAVALSEQPGAARPLQQVPTSPTAIAPRALSAYHRAAAVLAEAAPGCALDWSLLAAVGHVESGHGERAGTRLDVEGVAQPAVVGPAVDPDLPDTDGGELDGRPGQDRAVGPMQLLPSVWSAAAVDGDGDGERNPQDIDDATLATGVLLCASAPELGSTAGRRQALHRYNAAPGYVDLVQRLAAAYARTAAVPPAIDVTEGEPLPVSASAPDEDAPVSPTTVTPAEAARTPAASPRPHGPGAARTQTVAADPNGKPTSTATPTSTLSPTSTPAPTASTPDVTDEPVAQPTSAGPTAEHATAPAEGPTAEADPAPEPSEDPAGATSEVATEEPTAGSPAPTPTASATSGAAPVTGVWSATDEGAFLLGDTIVDVDALDDLSVPAPTDLDLDGTVEAIRAELEGLAGVTLAVVGSAAAGTVVVDSLDDLRRSPDSP